MNMQDTKIKGEVTPVSGGATLKVHGHVKWFDPAKGFGFVVSDAGGRDILLHANVLRNFGQSSVADGVAITLLAQETPRGIQAVEVLSLAPPSVNTTSAGLTDIEDLTEDQIANMPLQPARVKWFDKAKGFGFANLFGNAQDVFVHIEVLRLSGLAELQPGEAVCLRAFDGKRGKMAAMVQSWESAVR